MKEGISEALLKKYLEGTCNPEEAQQVEDWYLSYGRALSAEEMRSIMRNEELRLSMLRNIKIKAGFSQQVEEAPLLAKGRSSIGFNRTWLSIAAAVVLLFIALITFQSELFHVLGIKGSSVVLQNKNKTILKYSLPDKSVVWLNPGASIAYDDHFAKDARELEMQGEIFFEVAKDEQKPFIIHSGELVTKVLGTSFRIRVGPDKQEEVSVVSGMVAVSKQGSKHFLTRKLIADKSQQNEQAVLLIADQKVSLNKARKALVKTKEQENSSVKMWQRKSVSFDDASLKAIVDTLNRTFNVSIGLKNQALNNYTLTADFSKMNLISIMEIMSHSLNIQYEVSGDRIWLVKNKN